MARRYTDTDKCGSERPSERMFRRSRAAENRRRISANKDQKFFRFIFGLAGFGTFAVFLVILFMIKSAYGQEIGQETGSETVPKTALTRLYIGNFPCWI